MVMRFLLLILYIMGAMTVNAQPAKGRYVLKTREDVPQQHSAFDRNEYGGSLHEVMDLGRKYYSATLDVLDDGMVYFSTSNFFDTGNTCSRTTGDYLVRLERVSGNS